MSVRYAAVRARSGPRSSLLLIVFASICRSRLGLHEGNPPLCNHFVAGAWVLLASLHGSHTLCQHRCQGLCLLERRRLLLRLDTADLQRSGRQLLDHLGENSLLVSGIDRMEPSLQQRLVTLARGQEPGFQGRVSSPVRAPSHASMPS